MTASMRPGHDTKRADVQPTRCLVQAIFNASKALEIQANQSCVPAVDTVTLNLDATRVRPEGLTQSTKPQTRLFMSPITRLT